MLEDTIPERTVICHMQIKSVRVQRAVLQCCLNGVLLGKGREEGNR